MSKQNTAAFRIKALLRSQGERPDHDSLMALAFDAAHALDIVHGELAKGYRPGAGGSHGAWLEVESFRRGQLRRLSPGTLRRVSALAYRAASMTENF